MLPRHASTSRTEPVTDPSPAQTGAGTSRVKIWSPVDVVGGCETKINEILNTLSAI